MFVIYDRFSLVFNEFLWFKMDGVQETPTDDADECFEIQNTNLQQFRQLCANANEQSRWNSGWFFDFRTVSEYMLTNE